MPYPIACDEVAGGRAGTYGIHDPVDLRVGAVGEKHGLGVRVRFGDVAGPVILLVRTRVFVFLDQALLVLAHAAQRNQARLYVRTHALLIDVQARFRVAHQHAIGNEPSQGVPSLRVHTVVVHIDRRIEVDFGLADVQERSRVSVGQRAGLIRREHVVGETGNVARDLEARSVRTERPDE